MSEFSENCIVWQLFCRQVQQASLFNLLHAQYSATWIKGTLNFPPLSPLCAVRNEADPQGSKFDYGLSLLSLSMVTEGLIPGRQDAIKQISKSTLILCCNFMHHLYTEVLLDFNCWVIVRSISQQPGPHFKTLYLFVLEQGTIIRKPLYTLAWKQKSERIVNSCKSRRHAC